MTPQERLLHELSVILAMRPFALPGAPTPASIVTGAGGGAGAKPKAPTSVGGQLWNAIAGSRTTTSITDEEQHQQDLRRVQLALRTLGSFNFLGVNLLPFIRETVWTPSTHHL